MKRPAGRAAPAREHAPPHNTEAEQAVLGGIMLAVGQGGHDDSLAEALTLTPEALYHEHHREIFRAMHDLYAAGRPPDLILVTDALRQRDLLDRCGGAAYLTSLLDAVPTPALLPSHVGILRQHHHKRILAELGVELQREALNGHDPEELLALTRRVVGEIDSFTAIGERPRTDRIDGATLAGDAASPDAEWIPFLRLEGVVGRGLATLISSHGKTGKTTLLVHAVRRLPQMRALWITEEPRSLWRARVRRYPELASPNLVLVFANGRPWADLLADLRREEADNMVIILDTIRAVCGIADENDQAAVTAAIQPLVFLARQKGWALVLVHHLRKSAADVGLGHAGSHALVGLVDVAVELHRDAHTPARRVCKAISRFDATPSDWVAELRGDELHVLGDSGSLAAAETVRRVEAVLDEILRKREEIAALLEPPPSRGALHGALGALVREGRAVRQGRGTKGDPHRWSSPKNSFIHDLSPIRERMESGSERDE